VLKSSGSQCDDKLDTYNPDSSDTFLFPKRGDATRTKPLLPFLMLYVWIWEILIQKDKIGKVVQEMSPHFAR